MKLRFIQRRHETSDIWSYFFAPLSPLQWAAGQSLRLEIPAGYDTDERRFTIASAPYEQHIRITTRHSGSVFKKGLEQLVAGTEVDAYAVEGDFIWRHAHEPAVAVAIGLGITPYRSMLLERHHEGASLGLHLLIYARPNELLYSEELEALAAEHPEFTWEATHVHIGTDNIARFAPTSWLYLSGPEKVVDDLRKSLGQRNEFKQSRIITDRFSGSI